MPSRRPSIAELRAVAQPPGLIDRRSAEHWAGRLYMRRMSPYVTRWLVPTPATPNGLTITMIVVGLFGACMVALPLLWSAVLTTLLIQAYLLLDCVDGELARWRRTTSAAGVYLDRLGHHVVEAALVLGLGVRAAGGPRTAASWWVSLGAVAALLVVIGKLESDLVMVARSGAGLIGESRATGHESRVTSVRLVRRVFRFVPLHRLVGAVEISLLLLAAAVVDAVRGDLAATQVLLGAIAVMASIVAVGHPVTILTSERLR